MFARKIDKYKFRQLCGGFFVAISKFCTNIANTSVLVFNTQNKKNTKVIKMKKLDIATLRHPTSTQPEPAEFVECDSYAIVVSAAQYEENLRVAKERYIRQQMELFHML